MKPEPRSSFEFRTSTSSNKKKRCYFSDSYSHGYGNATKMDVANKKRRKELEFYDGCKRVIKGDEQSWDLLRELLDGYTSYRKLLREAVCSQGNAATDHGRTSLHILLEKNPPADIISTLIRYAPDVLSKNNKCGELPIHTACKSSASLEVLNVLIQAYPRGLEKQSDHGFLPIHDLCFHGATYEALDLLLQAYPDSVKVKDYENCLPIHRACRSFVNLKALDALLGAYPESIGEKSVHGKPSTVLSKYCRKNLIYKDQYGRTLLHYAFNGHFSADVAKLLADANPKGLEVQDCLGNVPASYGAKHKKIPEEEILRSYSVLAIYNEENIQEFMLRVAMASARKAMRSNSVLAIDNEENMLRVGMAAARKVATDIMNSWNASTLGNQSEKDVGNTTVDHSTPSEVTTNSSISEKASSKTTMDASKVSINSGTNVGFDAVRAPTKGATDMHSRKDASTVTENTAVDSGSKLTQWKTLHEDVSSNGLKMSLDSTPMMEAQSASNEEAQMDASSTKSREDNYLVESSRVREIMKMHKSQMILLKSKFFELNAQFAEMKSNVAELQSDNETLKGELSSMKKEIHELRSNNSNVNSSNKTLKVEVSSVKKDIGELQYLRENVFDELKNFLQEVKSDFLEMKKIRRMG